MIDEFLLLKQQQKVRTWLNIEQVPISARSVIGHLKMVSVGLWLFQKQFRAFSFLNASSEENSTLVVVY